MKKSSRWLSLVHEPQVVLLDEPTLGVDPVSRREFWNLLGNLRVEKGTTVFVCTPYMDEAERCVRVGLMYAGKLIADDTPANIKRVVTGELLELTPSDFISARELVASLAGVRSCKPMAINCMYSWTTPPTASSRSRRPRRARIEHDEIRKIEVRMEEAFISLIRRQTQSETAALQGQMTTNASAPLLWRN
jgi:ABC-2 type transport system ATP-binding protein